MQRVALVLPLGKCWLLSIRRLLAVVSRYDHPGPGHRLDQEQREDIQLYVDYLSQPAALVPPTPALTRPGRRRTVRLVSDASFTALCGSDTHRSCGQAGPGFRFPTRWLACKLISVLLDDPTNQQRADGMLPTGAATVPVRISGSSLA
jgi:hypothetical protein